MSKFFGPWSTAINTGARQDLNTFWKRRLAMLHTLSQSGSRATGRALVVLGFLAIGALAIPTLKRGTQAQTIVQVVESEARALQAGDAEKPGTAVERSEKQPAATKSGKAARAVEFLPRPTPDEEKIIAALEKPTTLEFLELPLDDAFQFLKEYHGIPIYVEKSAFKDAEVPLDSMATIKLKGVRFESALKLLLQPFPLDYLVEDDVLKITSKTMAQKRLMTRTYPVADLCGELSRIEGDTGRPKENNAEIAARPGSPYTALINTITATIDPDSWEELSGEGSSMPVRQAGSLVIRQTWSVHRKVLQLLRDLRESKQLGQVQLERTGRQPGTAAIPKLRHGERFSIIGIIDLDGDGHGNPGGLPRMGGRCRRHYRQRSRRTGRAPC